VAATGAGAAAVGTAAGAGASEVSGESILLLVGLVLAGLVVVGAYLWWQVTITGELDWPDRAEKRDGPPEAPPSVRAALRRYERWRAGRR
jgi:uncharacterized iron-regulated membrane protein